MSQQQIDLVTHWKKKKKQANTLEPLMVEITGEIGKQSQRRTVEQTCRDKNLKTKSTSNALVSLLHALFLPIISPHFSVYM